MEDVGRLDERVRKLQTHFGQAAKDIDDILVSSRKVTKRGQKIEALEFGVSESRAAPAKVEARHRVRPFQDRAVSAAGRRGRRRLSSRKRQESKLLCANPPAVPASSDAAGSVSPSTTLKWWRSRLFDDSALATPSPVQILASSAFCRMNSAALGRRPPSRSTWRRSDRR